RLVSPPQVTHNSAVQSGPVTDQRSPSSGSSSQLPSPAPPLASGPPAVATPRELKTLLPRLPFDHPHGNGSTNATGINAAAFVVGFYADEYKRRIGPHSHGFVRDPDGSISTCDYPDSLNS